MPADADRPADAPAPGPAPAPPAHADPWEALACAAATAAVRAARAGWPEAFARLTGDAGVRRGLAEVAAAAARLAPAGGDGPAEPSAVDSSAGEPPAAAAPPAAKAKKKRPKPAPPARVATPPPAESAAKADPPPAAPKPEIKLRPDAAPPAVTPPPPIAEPAAAPPAPAESAAPVASVAEIESRLTLGAADAADPPPTSPSSAVVSAAVFEGDPGLALTEDVRALAGLPARCRAKADALRWAAKRAAVGAEGDALRREKEDIRAAADAAGGSPWPLFDPPPPGDRAAPATWKRAAGTFDALAEAADHLHACRERFTDAAARGAATTDAGDPEADALRHALDLAAEAQSMALLAVRELSETADRDQKAVYKAIRDLSGEETGLGYYIRRYLKEGSSADPARHADLTARVKAAAAARHKEKRGRELFKKLTFDAEKFADKRDAGDAKRAEYHAGRAAKFAADLLEAGVPPSDVRFREALPADPAARAALKSHAPSEREHAALARVAEFLPDPGDADPADDGDPGDDAPEFAATVDEALDKSKTCWPGAFAYAFNNRSEPRGYPFKDADQFFRGLRFLATTFRDAMAGRKDCPDLVTACKEECGLNYSPNQSPSTMGEFPEYYRTRYDGEDVPLTRHVGRGNNKDPRLSFRLAFHYDKDRDRVVLGYLGQHQRTRAT